MFVLSAPPGSLSMSNLQSLPYAVEDGGVWLTAICRDSVEALQNFVSAGLLVDPDDLVSSLVPEDFQFAREGRLSSSSNPIYPYVVWKSRRFDNGVEGRLGAGVYPKGLEGVKLQVPSSSAGTLAAMVAEGALADPEGLFSSFTADVVICFDARYGDFVCVGSSYGDSLFENSFPDIDVVAELEDRGLSVSFSDDFSEEVYRGARALVGDGIQPEGISLDLFPYQRRTVAMLVERTGAGVFLAPGLGKTLVAISAGKELLNRGEIDRVVISPPGAVSRQWAREVNRFTGVSLDDVIVTMGTKAQRESLYKRANTAQWVIIHHDLLSRDYSQLSGLFNQRTLFVLDESHKGNNHTSARHAALSKLARKSGRRVIMTGTPILNTVMDWYSTMSKFVEPNIFGLKHFLSRYLHQDAFGGYNGSRNLDDLAHRSRYHFVRFRKEDVASHLAPLQVSNVPVEIDQQYKKALLRVHFAAADELAQHFVEVEDSEAVGNMTAYGMLRALCSSPRILFDSESSGAQTLIDRLGIPEIDGPKVDLILDIAQKFQENNERVVVFTYSRSMVKLLEERFEARGIRYVSYHGGTSDADRDVAAQAFTSVSGKGDDPTVFLATDAAAEGLNLGTQCCTLVNLDLPWTAGRLEQRYNRIHRVDGTHSSYVAVNLTLPDTVEDSILRKIESKASIADVIFGERSASEITGHSLGDTRSGGFSEAVREYERAHARPE